MKSLFFQRVEIDFKSRREVVASHLPAHTAEQGDHLIYLAGHVLHERPYTDVELPFRQESNFLYISGVQDIPGSHFIYSLKTKKSFLFLPAISDDDAVWIGPQMPMDKVQQKYQMDVVKSTAELKSTIAELQPACIHHLPDVAIGVLGVPKSCESNVNLLKLALAEARMVKSAPELHLMRLANKASSDAHAELMRFVKQATTSRMLGDGQSHFSEQEATAKWYAETLTRGCQFQAYLPIVAYGRNAATLHYNRNDALIPYNGDSFLLVDAGAEFQGYASDITRTYPINGKFDTPQKRGLYGIVLKAQMSVIEKIRAGVQWEDLHRHAAEIICQGLLDLGVLKSNGSSLHELCWKKFVVQRFFPHGLGHLIGIDVHDVGGYPPGVERIQEPGTRYLRMRRELKPGYVVTVEPGCYFVDVLIEAALKDPVQSVHIDRDVLEQYRPLGGVRIEDCVVVTASGYENLTSAPKTIEDIEKVMA